MSDRVFISKRDCGEESRIAERHRERVCVRGSALRQRRDGVSHNMSCYKKYMWQNNVRLINEKDWQEVNDVAPTVSVCLFVHLPKTFWMTTSRISLTLTTIVKRFIFEAQKVNYFFCSIDQFHFFQSPRAWGQSYKTLRTRSLQQMDRSCCELVSFLLSVTNTQAWASTLAYYIICKLWIRDVFKVQGLYSQPFIFHIIYEWTQ
jgi:hypothetical protein